VDGIDLDVVVGEPLSELLTLQAAEVLLGGELAQHLGRVRRSPAQEDDRGSYASTSRCAEHHSRTLHARDQATNAVGTRSAPESLSFTIVR
jgi:hypothetical protein